MPYTKTADYPSHSSPSIFNVPVGSGRVIAFTFDPLHRFMDLHEARVVWNTIMHWDHLKWKFTNEAM